MADEFACRQSLHYQCVINCYVKCSEMQCCWNAGCINAIPTQKGTTCKFSQYIFKYEHFSAVCSFVKFIRPPPGNREAARAVCMHELASRGSNCSCCSAPDSGEGQLLFFSDSLNHCLIFVPPLACLLAWWAAACLPGEGQQGRRRLFVPRAKACKGSSLSFPVNHRGSCPVSVENALFQVDATRTGMVSGHWELQRQRGVMAAKDKALPGYLQTSSTSPREGVGMIECVPWK